jgi:chromosome partitioning protein
MRIVALGQQKGGVGKSAAAINLACQAVADSKKAVIIDMDVEQATVRKWGARRIGVAMPRVLSADVVTLPVVIVRLKAEGVDWVFLDLPGRNAPLANAGLKASDLILIPCRPLDMDIEASVATVRSAKGSNTPYAYLMNIAPPQVDKRRAKQMASTLSALGHAVAPTIIVQRVVVPDAIAAGKSADEADPKGESAAEFKELFGWLKKTVKDRT